MLKAHESDPKKTPREFLNQFLKEKTNAMGQSYGFDMMYLPTYVDYSEQDMKIVRKGTIKY